MTRSAIGALALLSLAPAAAMAAVVDVTVAPGGVMMFEAANVVIDLGDTVRWTWEGSGHNVVAGTPGSPTGAFRSGDPAGLGTTFEVVFDQAFLDAFPALDNLYDYHCEPHGAMGMVGSVSVRMDPTPTEEVTWSQIKNLY
jgi:plastocyanin